MSLRLLAASLVALAATAPATAAVVSATNSTPGYFDASADTRTVSFSDTGSILDLNIQVHFAKCDGEVFVNAGAGCAAGGTPYFNEIHFSLTGPDSTTIELVPSGFFSSGNSGSEFTILFDSDSANTLGSVPASGTVQPSDSLTSFNGKALAGTWSLLVQDTTGADALSFYDYTITATTDTSDVPEPAMIGLFGLGALGLGLSRRRKAA